MTQNEADLFRFEVPTSRGKFVVIGPDTLPPDEAARIGAQIGRLLPLMVLEPEEIRTEDEFRERPCPACGAALAPADTHWSLFPEPMGGYLCPEPVR